MTEVTMLDLSLILRALDREMVREFHQTAGGDATPSSAERIIMATVAREGQMTVGAIVKATGFVQSYVSGVVSRLVDQGLLVSDLDPHDRRRTIISFQPERIGRIKASLDLDVRPLVARILGDAPPEATETVVHALKILAVALEHEVPAGLFMPSPGT